MCSDIRRDLWEEVFCLRLGVLQETRFGNRNSNECARCAAVPVPVLLLFGARKLPEIARSLGESIKEFKKSISKGESNQDEQKKDV